MSKVIKRDASVIDFNKHKISAAMLKAMKNGSGIVEERIAYQIADEIEQETKEQEFVDIYEIECLVYDKLIKKGQSLTAKAYEGYRRIREFQRESVNTIDNDITQLLDGDSDYWKHENANKNADLNTTKRDYMAGIVSTDAVRRYLLSPEIVQAHDEGIIHFHDADYFLQHMANCCVFNLEDMLQNGTVISEVLIEKPHSFSTACTITTQIIAQVASSQYGGQTISLAHLAPFVDISRQRIRKEVIAEHEVIDTHINGDAINYITEERLRKEITKGIQTIQYQLVTLMTTNGQAPFITIFMYLNEAKNSREKADLAILIEEVLNQRITGVKNCDGVYIAPAFPKLIYVLEEDNITEDSDYWYLTKLAAECSAKRLVPDYISEKMMLELKGDVYGCMGCVDGDEIITYKYNNNLYVESFERMWDRLSEYFKVYRQGDMIDNPNRYIDLTSVEIYDTEKGFVNASRIIRNISKDWVDVHLSNGRRLLCTSDHPFEIYGKGVVEASKLSESDKILVNSSQYYDERIMFEPDKAWLLGVMLCDGCYSSNHVYVSVAATGEDEIEDMFHKTFKKYFDLDTYTVLRERGKKGTYKDLIVKSNYNGDLQKAICYFTEKFGGLQKINRHIPSEVFSWNYESKLAFLAGMIDADGYVNDHTTDGAIIQIGSTNKELALQQMALAQSLGMPTKIYHNHYNKKKPEAIRYRVEFYANDELMQYIVCNKKVEHYERTYNNHYNTYSEVKEVIHVDTIRYSYDVTTDSEHFEVSGIYSHNCRSFLTPDRFTDAGIGNIANAKNYEPGKHKYYGRFNQGVVTISLPDIAFSSGGDMDKFWELFYERTELCHKALKTRHNRLKGTSSDVAPILWQYGALARLEKHEPIDRLLYDGYSTISLGYAGLYECVKYMTGCSHSDEGIGEKFGLEVMQALNDQCNKWKKEENIDYSLYGTPLENTTYKMAKKLKERFGKDIFVQLDGADRNYITNSYHIPVFEPIDAFEKLRIESKFQKLSPGGAISYVESPSMVHNSSALLEVIKYMYEHIMYAEINTKSCYCEKCGFDGEIPLIDENGTLKWKCPKCGNDDNTTMDIAFRVCGYIGTAKNGGNQGRYGDIHDRVRHIDDMEYTED